MSPAFSSTRQAAAFALLLLAILLSPIIFGKSILAPREQNYASMSWESGPFPYLDQQIFKEKGDIDIAIVGSSHLLLGIDTPHIQEALSEKLGRPAVVRSICWGGAGFDGLFFIARDLLQNRKVHLLVFYDEYHGRNEPMSLAPTLFRLGGHADDLVGLPWQHQAVYYFAAILGMPRNLLCLARPNLSAELISPKKNFLEVLNQAVNPAARLGSLGSQLGFSPDYRNLNTTFIPFVPLVDDRSSAVCLYSAETRARFDFSGAPTPGWELHFAKKFAALAREEGTRLLLLHVPMLDDVKATVIREREFWPDILGPDVSIMGIEGATLFGGMAEDEVHKLYQDPFHLSKNGQEYFTRVITPRLLQTYESLPAR